jgi:hypothetical protein
MLHGRRTLVFLRQTDSRDIQPRLAKILRDAGLRTVILRSSVSTRRREAWVKQRIKDGLDVLICNPRLVQTGLDLVDFATSIFFEINYSTYTMMQASRRTWRPGQTKDVRIYFPVYANTMEHRAVAHVGKKVAAAQTLYGDDITGALVDQSGAGGGFLQELAREVVANAEIPDLADIFVQKHRAVEGSGWLLGDDGPDLSDHGNGTLLSVSASEIAPLDPRQSVQLTLF